MNEPIVDYSMAIICRICEKGEELLFLNEKTDKSIVKKLRACADVNFEFNDLLPKYICKDCHSNLEFAYKFKIQCEYTDRKFRDCVSKRPVKQEIQSIEITPAAEMVEVNGIKYEYYRQSEDVDNLIEVCDETTGDAEQFIVDENIDEDEYSEDSDKQYDDGLDFQNSDNEQNDIERYPYDDQESQDFTHEILSEVEDKTLAIRILKIRLESSNLQEHGTDSQTFMCKEDGDGQSLCQKSCPGRFVPNTKKSIRNKQKTDNKRFTCDTCGEVFNVFTEFNSHKKTHGQFRYQCKICQKWFSKRYYLKSHEKLHLGFKAHKCEMCGKTYTNQGNLDRHIRVTHKNDRRYKCDECGKSFSQLTILRQHQAVHITERKFACDICTKTFKTPEYLALHKARHLPKIERPKPVRYRPNKKKYKPVYKPCVCTECGKTSTNMTLHLSHMKTHSSERPYECKVCNKRFSFKQSLRNHAYVHTGEKPYTCDQCGMAFRQIGHLKGHKLIHSGKKEHMCLICGKSFALRGNLTVHSRLHTGETPYHCPYCAKKFYDSNGLRRHRALHEYRNDPIDLAIKNAMDASQFDSNELQNDSDEIVYNLLNQIIEAELPEDNPISTPMLMDGENDVIVGVNDDEQLLRCIQIILPPE